MTGYRVTTRGRYKCSFCDHPSYKRLGGVMSHIRDRHELELANATIEEMRGKIDRLQKQPPKIVEKEKIVYRDAPKPAPKKTVYWYVRDYGMAGIYCTSCKQVQLNVGIPEGQTIENTPHKCGNRTLLPVVEVK